MENEQEPFFHPETMLERTFPNESDGAGTAAPPAAWQASYIPKTIGNPEVQRCHASFYQNLTF